MDEVRLGNTGLWVSPIWLGMMSYGDPDWRPWILDEAAAVPFIEQALDLGITTFDTADVYSNGVSEEITGKLLLSRVDRDEVVIATKLFGSMRPGARNASGLGRKHVFDAVDASLRRLGTDHIDLFQLHAFDARTPVEETLAALDDLVRAGKIRYVGASNYSGWQLMKSLDAADRHGRARFAAHQVYYSLVGREYEWELMPLAIDQKVGALVWSPLGWGRLTGRIRRGTPLPTDHASVSVKMPGPTSWAMLATLVLVIVKPYVAAGWSTMRFMNRTEGFVLCRLEEATGVGVLVEISDFFTSMSGLLENFHTRVERAYEVLRAMFGRTP